MSSQNNLSLQEALELFQQEVFIELADTNVQNVQRISREVAREVDEQYDQFFEDIVDIVLSRLGDLSEAVIKIGKFVPGGEWKDISTPWDRTKHTRIGMPRGDNWHYMGISGATTQAKGLKIRRKYGPGQIDRGIPRNDGRTARSPNKKKVRPFAEYLQTLQAAGTTDKFFGPVTLNYQFHSPIPGQKVTATMAAQTTNSLLPRNAIAKIVTRNKGRFDKMAGELDVSVSVEGFGALKHVQKLEWFIVDYIIKRIDRANEKQWVKINGEVAPGNSRKDSKGRNLQHGRKVKPLILPMIQFYINDALPRAMRKGIK